MESIEKETIKILSYNILAQSLLSDSLNLTEEVVKKTDYLDMDYRCNKIVELINKLNPDICLFQEYEHNGKLKDKLKANNSSYEILYKKRPGNHQEGCAIAYDTKKFRLEYYCSLEFRLDSLKDGKYKDYSNNNTKKKQNQSIYNKENVGIFAFLKSYETNFYYLIICSHLLFNYNRGDIKLGQIYQIIQSALLFKAYYKDKNFTTIFGADLNSTNNSAIYNFITSNSIDVKYLIRGNLSGQTNKNYISETSCADDNYGWYNEIINTYPKFNDYNIILKNKKKKKYDKDEDEDEKGMCLENKFIMKSFYKEKIGKEPEATNFSIGFKGALDFLFYNTNLKLDINNVLDIPNLSTPIPDKDNPSDHFPLFVEFSIQN
jgi:mRNA deadenylase 3'-5' endonuclease subunit Ccr4